MSRHKGTHIMCFVCWKQAKSITKTKHDYFFSFEATHTNGTIHRWSVLHK